MNCPECSAELEWQARFSELVVCDSCQTASRLSDGGIHAVGRMAQLAHTPGPLYLGATGRLGKKTFTVLGRVRYRYAQGFWDEWLLSMSDGGSRWVAEDEAEHTVMRQVKRGDALSLMRRAAPGGRLSLGERSFHVDEKSQAQCVGGEGQLPFVIRQGDEIGYADLSGGGDHVATIEIDAEGGGRVYVGKKVSASVFKVDVPLGGSDLDAFRSDVAEPEGMKVATGADAKQVGCVNCGAPLAVEGGKVEASCSYCGTTNPTDLPTTECPACDRRIILASGSAASFCTCPNCDAFLRLDRGKAKRIKKKGKKNRVDSHKIYFKLGQRFRFDDVDYVLTGEICTKEVDDGVYYCREYYLYHPHKGYRILEEENGHYCLCERVTVDSEFPDLQKLAVYHDKKKFLVFESGSTAVDFVRGQFPYAPEVGDRVAYTDAICPPYVLNKSSSEDEVEYYYGRYVSAEEVGEATGVALEDLPLAVGVAPSQPYTTGPLRSVAKKSVLAFFDYQFAGLVDRSRLGHGGCCARRPRSRGGIHGRSPYGTLCYRKKRCLDAVCSHRTGGQRLDLCRCCLGQRQR